MTPGASIAMLDRNIARHGQTVLLRRGSTEVTVRAFVREYKPDEIVGPIGQGDSNVVLSPTQIVGTPFATAPLARNDKVVVRGRVRNIEAADPVLLDDQLVRINLQVRG
jgi:hypothetical protein